jgi:hypothetical protein
LTITASIAQACSHTQEDQILVLLNHGMKKISGKSKRFVKTGFYDGHI